MLHEEFTYFIEHQSELVKTYNGKYIVIKGQQVIGEYDTVWAAYIESQKEHPLGTFLIQKCEPGPEAYTVDFHSHAVFA